jgi:DNA topoisomerase-1
LNCYLDGTLVETLKKRAEKQLARSLPALPPEEAAVLALLQQRLKGEKYRLQHDLKASLKQAKAAKRKSKPN